MQKTVFYNILDDLFHIRQGEFARTLLMFFYLTNVVSAFITGRVIRDTLFLKRWDISYLPLMYIAVAITVSIISYIYSKFADQVRRDRLILIITSLIFCSILISRWLVDQIGNTFYPVFYVWVEVFGSLIIIQFWTFANDIFNPREGKRLFGLIGGGGVLANIIAGLTIRSMAKDYGPENLMFLCAVNFLFIIIIVYVLGKLCRNQLITSHLSPVKKTGKSGIAFSSDSLRVLSSNHLKIIAGIVACTFLATTFVDYQFKYIAKESFKEAHDMATFFADFYLYTGVIAGVIQFLITSRLLERYGIMSAMLILPIALLGGSAAMTFWPLIIPAILAKGSENVFRYTINDASTQLLYIPVPGHVRGRAKAFIDGILKPLSIGVSGAIIYGLSKTAGLFWIGIMTLVLLVIWLVLTIRIKKEYVSSLLDTLKSRKLNFSDSSINISDDITKEILCRTLHSDSSDREILHALELLPHVTNFDWRPELGELIFHRSSEVRIKAIQYLGRAGGEDYACWIREIILDDDSPSVVKAAACLTYCCLGKEKAIDDVLPYLNSKSPQLKKACLVGLIKYGGLDGILHAADELKGLLHNEAQKSRQHGAQVLGEIGVKNFYHPLISLLNDSSLEVKIEAIMAAGKLTSPELLPILLDHLGKKDTVKVSITALAKFNNIEEQLTKVLTSPKEDLYKKRNIAKILAKIASPAALKILQLHMDEMDDELRMNVVKGINQIIYRHPNLKFNHKKLTNFIYKELTRYYQQLVIIKEMGLNEETDSLLLKQALIEKQNKIIDELFTILAVIYPRKNIELVYYGLKSTVVNVRANAIEVIDNLLDNEKKRLLLPILEKLSDDDQIRRVSSYIKLVHKSQPDWIKLLLTESSPWITCCTINYIAYKKFGQFKNRLIIELKAKDPIVRETTLFTLQQLTCRDEFKRIAQEALKDPHPLVKNYAAFLVEQQEY